MPALQEQVGLAAGPAGGWAPALSGGREDEADNKNHNHNQKNEQENVMKLPVWFDPAIKGAIGGAVALAIVGFSWGGWVTGGTARQLASDRARADVVEALTLVCMEQSRRDPQATQKLAELRAASSWSRPEVVMKSGWATMPGSSDPNRDVAASCGSKLLV